MIAKRPSIPLDEHLADFMLEEEKKIEETGELPVIEASKNQLLIGQIATQSQENFNSEQI